MLTVIAHVKPLPEADGLVDKHGHVIPDSQEQAREIVRQANKSVESVLRNNVEIITNGNPTIKDESFIQEPNTMSLSSESVKRNVAIDF
ncbi:hypothetical protein [Pantoea sp. App145]|uniref:hypothetical protein n=1 Tax=Pantoea sp. App145 TaxID=3071567 RepID=UPI003A80EBEA